MQVHEAWRDEIGWIIVVIGAVLLIFGLMDQFTRALVVGTSVQPWIVYVTAGVLVIVGLLLHAARPGRGGGEDQSEQPPSPSPDDQSEPPAP